MKTFRPLLILFLICGICSAEDAVTFTTKSGRKLRDVVVTSDDGQSAMIRHSGGVMRIPLTEIPSDIRDQLGLQGNALLDARATSIEELKPVLEAQLAKDLKAVADFESKYESHLQVLAGQTQQAGQLERLMLVKAEIESFRKGVHQDSSTFSDLQKAQSIFSDNRPDIAASAASRQAETMRLYIRKLDGLKKVLTQNGNLEKAIEVAEEQKRVHQLIEKSRKSAVVAAPDPAEEEGKAGETMTNTSQASPKSRNRHAPDDALPHGDSLFKVFLEQISWTDAKKACERKRGRLAVIKDQETCSFIQEIAKNFSLWLGASDKEKEGEWIWVDGSPMDFDNWSNNSPSNTAGVEHFLATKNDGPWNDVGDFPHLLHVRPVGYICEWVNE